MASPGVHLALAFTFKLALTRLCRLAFVESGAIARGLRATVAPPLAANATDILLLRMTPWSRVLTVWACLGCYCGLSPTLCKYRLENSPSPSVRRRAGLYTTFSTTQPLSFLVILTAISGTL